MRNGCGAGRPRATALVLLVAGLAAGAGATVRTAQADPAPRSTTFAAASFDGMWGSAGPPARVAGDDRYETAVEVARRAGQGSLTSLTDLIVVSGEKFADAVVASGLAGYLDRCPRSGSQVCGQTAILLTRPHALPLATADAVAASGVPAARITVIGGTSAVSAAVHHALARAAGWNGTGTNPVVRISGGTRYETAAAVADHVRTLASREGLPTSYRTVLISTGTDFPDALSAGVLAYRFGHLLLLVPPTSVPTAVTRAIQDLGASCATAVGGPVAIPDGVLDTLRTSLGSTTGGCDERRLAGADRYATAIAVAERLRASVEPPGSEVGVLLASGIDYADALTATTLSRREIMLLTAPDHLPQPTREWVLSRPSLIDQMTVVGGPGAVSERIAFQANNPQPTPTPAAGRATPPLIAGPDEADHERCRIPQTFHSRDSYRGGHSVGFPLVTDNLQPDQVVTLGIIPVDWSDHPGDPADLPSKYAEVRTFVDYYERASEGQLTFTAEWPSAWYRLPDPVTTYPQQQMSDFNNKLAQHAVDAADPHLDFSTVDIVILVFPDFPPIPVTDSEYVFGSTQHFNAFSSRDDPRMIFSDEGWVRNYVGAGNHFDHRLRPVWSYYIHEVAHTFNIADWYMREANVGTPEYRPDRDYEVGPLGQWGVMSSQDGPSRTFVAWTRWLVGWLDDEQVACFELDQIVEHGTFEVELVPLDLAEPGTKAVIVRTGPHHGFVIESRRPVFPDHDLVYFEPHGREPRGLIVYQVDATKGNADGTLSLVVPEGQSTLPAQMTGRMSNQITDALYNEGAVGFLEGLRVELVHSGARDVVRIGPA